MHPLGGLQRRAPRRQYVMQNIQLIPYSGRSKRTRCAACSAARRAIASRLAPPPLAAPQPVTLADGGCSMRAEMAADRRLGGFSTSLPANCADKMITTSNICSVLAAS